MSDVYVRRYQDWDYSNPKGAKRRWFYRVNGQPVSSQSSEFEYACVRAAVRIWRRRALRQRRAAHLGEQLELFARATDDTIKLMMPGDDKARGILTCTSQPNCDAMTLGNSAHT